MVGLEQRKLGIKRRGGKKELISKQERKVSPLLASSDVLTSMVHVLQWQMYIPVGFSVVDATNGAQKF